MGPSNHQSDWSTSSRTARTSPLPATPPDPQLNYKSEKYAQGAKASDMMTSPTKERLAAATLSLHGQASPTGGKKARRRKHMGQAPLRKDLPLQPYHCIDKQALPVEKNLSTDGSSFVN